MAKYISVDILLTRLKYGDDEAIEILYPRYAKVFYTYVKNCGLTHEDAEDIVEETFLHVLKSIKTYDEAEGHGESWLWRICKNIMTDLLRRKRTACSLMDDRPVDEFPSEDTNPARCFERKEYFQALDSAWQRISKTDREELQLGRGRGPGRKAWHKAVQKFRAAFYEEW
jgi:RNA polymerase sigma-70 factor, ECF subfamily